MSLDLRSMGGGSEMDSLGRAPDGDLDGEVHDPLTVAERGRYRPESTLGEGGMGLVQAALDRRLERPVAVKRAVRRDVVLERQLRHEARMLSELEHPGIPVILDAGIDETGEAFYVMPQLHGETLGGRIARLTEDETSVSHRLALLGQVLAACQAVAHAHDRGIVHRDLKPENIMLGPRGEVHVIDWGLATRVGEASSRSSGRPVGTAGYRSPEQRAGGAPDPRADVWSLGAVLHAVLLSPLAADAKCANPRQLRDLDPELAAVVERALHGEPERRYPDAGALADDLERLITGRWVRAHRYGFVDLIRWVWRRHRVVFSSALVVVASLLVAAGWTYVSTERARLVAVEAERSKGRALDAALDARARETRALESAKDALRYALLGQARRAARTGANAKAELLALRSLELGESPEARGILVATHSRERPRLVRSTDIEACKISSVSPDGSTLVCTGGGGIVVHDVSTGEVVAPAPSALAEVPAGRVESLVIGDDGLIGLAMSKGRMPVWAGTLAGGIYEVQHHLASIVVFAPHEGGFWVAGAQGAPIHMPDRIQVRAPCEGAVAAPPDFSTDRTGQWLGFLCVQGHVEFHRGGVTQVVRYEPEKLASLASIDLSSDADVAWLGSRQGVVVEVEVATGRELRRIASGVDRIRMVRASPDGRLLAIVGEREGVAIVDRVGGHVLHRLPTAWVSDAAFSNARTLHLVAEHLETWALPNESRIRKLEAPAGIASVCVDDGDRFIAAVDGSGHLSVWDRATGAVIHRTAWQELVAKDCAFSPDGRRLAVVTVGDGLSILETTNWAREHVDCASKGQRRVDWLVDDVLVLPYAGGPRRIPRGGQRCDPVWSSWDDAKDAGASPGHDAVVVVNETDGRITLLSRDGNAELMTDPDAVAVDTSDRGQMIAVANAHGVVLYDENGNEIERFDAGDARVLDVALGPGGRHVAAGTLSGDVLVWVRGQVRPRAILEGHDGRTVDLGFDADGDVLVSASWDHTVRTWDLRALDLDAPDALARAEVDWGRSAVELDGLLDF